MGGNSQHPDCSPTTTDVANCKRETPANPLGNQCYGDKSTDSDTSVPMTKIVKFVTEKFPICLKNNPLNSKNCLQGSLKEETLPEITGKLVLLSYHTNSDTGFSWY